MAIGDITRNVVTKYKADVGDHKTKLGELVKETKSLANAEDDAAKKRDKSMGDHLDGMKKIVGAIAGAKLAFDGYKLVVEETRLRTAAAGVDMDKLARAAGGLKTNMQLLGEAAKLNAAPFKLTSDQMATAEQAMRQLTRAGFEQEDVSKKVLDAIVKLEGDGLKDFGIRVRATTTDADKFKAIMEALGAEAKKVDGATLTQAESMAQMGVQFEQTFDTIKRAVGDMVVALAPLIKLAAELAGVAATLVTALSGKNSPLDRQAEEVLGPGGFMGAMRRGGNPATASAASLASSSWLSRGSVQSSLDREREEARIAAERRTLGIGPMFGREYAGSFGGVGGMLGGEYAKQFGGIGRLIAKEFKAEVATGAGRAMRASPIGGVSYESATGPGAMTGGLGADAGWSAGSTQFDPSQWIGQDHETSYQQWIDSGRASAGNESKLASIFGPLEEFSGYQLAFQALGGAVTSAMTAWIDGSMSAGKAVKLFFAESLKGLATSMAVEALKHSAYALGSLAFGDFRGAGQHALAAAGFGAAAAAAAVGAKTLGTSAGGAGGGAGAAPGGSYVSGGSNNSQPTTSTIVIGNGFVEGGPRERQIYATRLVEAARTSGAVTYSS